MKRILMKRCNAPAKRGDAYCAPCGHWARVTLADKKYRNTPPPARPEQPALLEAKP